MDSASAKFKPYLQWDNRLRPYWLYIVDNVSPGLVELFPDGVSLSNTVILYMTIVR